MHRTIFDLFQEENGAYARRIQEELSGKHITFARGAHIVKSSSANRALKAVQLKVSLAIAEVFHLARMSSKGALH